MRLKLRLNRRAVRRWHISLLHRLAALPDVVITLETVTGAGALPHAAELLFELETLIYGLARDGAAAHAPQSALASYAVSGPADLTVDLSGHAAEAQGRVWRLTFDGAEGEAALFSILLSGRVPHAAVMDGEKIVAAGRLGSEHGGIAVASFEDVLARVQTLIVAALQGGASTILPALPLEDTPTPAPVPPAAGPLAKAAMRALTRAIIQRLYRLCYYAPHWRVGWRRLDGPDLFDLRHHPGGGWRNLEDDGTRFYADPFPVLHRGDVILFVEDYAHKLGKGIISAVTFTPQGPAGTPRPVLEQPGHLSYPFVFEQDDQMWMIPESCATRSIDLFRATAFPGGWVKEATLICDVRASDATLVQHGGVWWLFATVQDGGGAFSDALYLWSAPDFRGPFTPHARNPVLIDIASARPAGRMVERNGALLRPVQDCRRSYGAALGIARVTRLDAEGFAQNVESVIGPGPAWPGRRLHTLNSAGGLEFIDGSALARRWAMTRAIRV